MNPPLPAAIGSGSLCGTKPNNVKCVPSAESMAVGKQSQKHLPIVNQNSAQEKGWAATSNPSVTAAKSSSNANPMDSTHRVQLVFQHGPNPGPPCNPMVWSSHLIDYILLKISVVYFSDFIDSLCCCIDDSYFGK